MDLRLTIDRGNTALKAALWSPEGQLLASDSASGDCTAGELACRLVAALPDAPDARFSAAVYCSVVDGLRKADIDGLQAMCGKVISLDASTPLPIEIGYQSPASLGADRIAAAVGAVAYAQGAAVLVADIGTAVTYDFVDAAGRYAGGNIAPGIDMRLEALHAHTAALPRVGAEGSTPMWGLTTSTAMRSGAVRGVVAELDYYRRAAGKGARVVLTGGSARLLADSGLLDFEFIHDPFLVMKGLNSILHYNETI